MMNGMADIPAFDRDRLAQALRNQRARVGLSLSEAAQRAGLGKSTLSTLESGSGNPSIETLWALASTYGVPLALLIEPPAPQVTVTRRDELPFLRSDDSPYEVALVSACPPGSRRDVYYAAVEPGGIKSSDAHPAGVVEHVLVTSGRAVIEVNGQRVELEEGDCLRYRGDVPHTFEALSPGTTAVYVVEMPDG